LSKYVVSSKIEITPDVVFVLYSKNEFLKSIYSKLNESSINNIKDVISNEIVF
jgi:hypothetical protein